jgi:hypothetical protein
MLGGMVGCAFLYGLILSNFNAIAMQPMGQAAGMAVSLPAAIRQRRQRCSAH